MPQLLAMADCFAMSSNYEGVPKALLEAMASALPIISTRVGGIPEIVRHEESALFAERGDEAGLAECFNRLINDPALASQLGLAARQGAEERFSVDQMIRQYIECYALVLK